MISAIEFVLGFVQIFVPCPACVLIGYGAFGLLIIGLVHIWLGKLTVSWVLLPISAMASTILCSH